MQCLVTDHDYHFDVRDIAQNMMIISHFRNSASDYQARCKDGAFLDERGNLPLLQFCVVRQMYALRNSPTTDKSDLDAPIVYPAKSPSGRYNASAMARYESFNWYEEPLYYDIIFDTDTDREADFLQAVYKQYITTRGSRVLEPACGTGRLVAEMARRGFAVLSGL